ncbi:hypothetical protein CBR_g11957 [Chara braunii]|uniref:Endonuclease/exonuclease/phosphatase domain-containing protein n=1 Tax=Chara braunii TaxID=69332 RepID=A0A388KQS0_CHABU|nr:hypothetical protein CBR_g11957 [Chara braunii]|eukprot:GBG72379.1 hypothetical protein CBR_g11957 [Chara braunii]
MEVIRLLASVSLVLVAYLVGKYEKEALSLLRGVGFTLARCLAHVGGGVWRLLGGLDVLFTSLVAELGHILIAALSWLCAYEVSSICLHLGHYLASRWRWWLTVDGASGVLVTLLVIGARCGRMLGSGGLTRSALKRWNPLARLQRLEQWCLELVARLGSQGPAPRVESSSSSASQAPQLGATSACGIPTDRLMEKRQNPWVKFLHPPPLARLHLRTVARQRFGQLRDEGGHSSYDENDKEMIRFDLHPPLRRSALERLSVGIPCYGRPEVRYVTSETPLCDLCRRHGHLASAAQCLTVGETREEIRRRENHIRLHPARSVNAAEEVEGWVLFEMKANLMIGAEIMADESLGDVCGLAEVRFLPPLRGCVRGGWARGSGIDSGGVGVPTRPVTSPSHDRMRGNTPSGARWDESDMSDHPSECWRDDAPGVPTEGVGMPPFVQAGQAQSSNVGAGGSQQGGAAGQHQEGSAPQMMVVPGQLPIEGRQGHEDAIMQDVSQVPVVEMFNEPQQNDPPLFQGGSGQRQDGGLSRLSGELRNEGGIQGGQLIRSMGERRNEVSAPDGQLSSPSQQGGDGQQEEFREGPSTRKRSRSRKSARKGKPHGKADLSRKGKQLMVQGSASSEEDEPPMKVREVCKGGVLVIPGTDGGQPVIRGGSSPCCPSQGMGPPSNMRSASRPAVLTRLERVIEASDEEGSNAVAVQSVSCQEIRAPLRTLADEHSPSPDLLRGRVRLSSPDPARRAQEEGRDEEPEPRTAGRDMDPGEGDIFMGTKVGVAIILTRFFTGKVQDYFWDTLGRWTWMFIEEGGTKSLVATVYAPVDVTERKWFWRNFAACLPETDVVQLIGDFNTVIRPGMDSVVLGDPRPDVEALRGLMADMALVDVFRRISPDDRNFTWFGTSPFFQSRLDMEWVSSDLLSNLLGFDQQLVPISDHKVIVVSLALHPRVARRPPPMSAPSWSLFDALHRELVQQHWEHWLTLRPQHVSPLEHLHHGVQALVGIMKKKAKASRQAHDQTCQEYLRRIEALGEVPPPGNEDEWWAEWVLLYSEWASWQARDAELWGLGSKSKWVRDAECMSRAFFAQMKKTSHLPLIVAMGHPFDPLEAKADTNPDIIKYVELFYENLYCEDKCWQEEDMMVVSAKDVWDKCVTQVSPEFKAFLDALLT